MVLGACASTRTCVRDMPRLACCPACLCRKVFKASLPQSKAFRSWCSLSSCSIAIFVPVFVPASCAQQGFIGFWRVFKSLKHAISPLQGQSDGVGLLKHSLCLGSGCLDNKLGQGGPRHLRRMLNKFLNFW